MAERELIERSAVTCTCVECRECCGTGRALRHPYRDGPGEEYGVNECFACRGEGIVEYCKECREME